MSDEYVQKLAEFSSLEDLLYVRRILIKEGDKQRALETVEAAIKLKQENNNKHEEQESKSATSRPSDVPGGK